MAQRMQHQYGVLIPNVQHLNSVLTSISKQSAATPASTEKDPNVLPLCSNETNTNWFILLPVVVPSKVVPETTLNKSTSSATDAKTEKVCFANLFRWGIILIWSVLAISAIKIHEYFAVHFYLQHSRSPSKGTTATASSSSSSSSSQISQSSAQQNLANVKSNAAAFFGAMSQEWFR